MKINRYKFHAMARLWLSIQTKRQAPSLGCDLEDAYLGPLHSVYGDGCGLAEPSSKGSFDQTPN
jgi:hypothetical protein